MAADGDTDITRRAFILVHTFDFGGSLHLTFLFPSSDTITGGVR